MMDAWTWLYILSAPLLVGGVADVLVTAKRLRRRQCIDAPRLAAADGDRSPLGYEPVVSELAEQGLVDTAAVIGSAGDKVVMFAVACWSAERGYAVLASHSPSETHAGPTRLEALTVMTSGRRVATRMYRDDGAWFPAPGDQVVYVPWTDARNLCVLHEGHVQSAALPGRPMLPSDGAAPDFIDREMRWARDAAVAAGVYDRRGDRGYGLTWRGALRAAWHLSILSRPIAAWGWKRKLRRDAARCASGTAARWRGVGLPRPPNDENASL